MTIEEMIENMKDRRRDASADAAESHKAAPNSYGAGYDRGYLDVLEQLLNDAERTQSWYCEPCAVEVYDRVCVHCGKTRRQQS